MTTTVSIIIPTRNRAASLPRAIESVLAQTYTDWELIVVNDQSTDETAEVIAAYRAKDRRIQGVIGNREGSGLARNVGIRYSQGRYVAFLDDDDLWLPEKLAAQVEVVEQMPDVSLVFTDASVMRGTDLERRASE